VPQGKTRRYVFAALGLPLLFLSFWSVLQASAYYALGQLAPFLFYIILGVTFLAAGAMLEHRVISNHWKSRPHTAVVERMGTHVRLVEPKTEAIGVSHETRFCISCRTMLPLDAKFCDSCGASQEG
jgi:hypothetical protein